LFFSGNALTQDASYNTEILAPGYNKLSFEAPEPGSYTLAKYKPASNGTVIDQHSNTTTLHNLFDDKVVLLNFMYSTCQDINGCPLATAVFHKVKNLLMQEPEIGKHVSLLSVSFDPKNDTPEVMKLYGAGTENDIVNWDFITTDSENTLEPILNGYNQRILKDYDADGNYLGSISHILRVFLIDKDKSIRNIYSVSFLHSDILINDVKTLLDKRTDNGSKIVVSASNDTKPKLAEPGDFKEGYESKDYVSRAKSLTREGKEADLIKFTQKQQLGLPELDLPKEASLTREKIALGRKMFFDRRLSHTDTISCAICHVAEMGFAHNELKTAVGTEGRSVPRNAPTVVNSAFLTRFFHDARENSLENQVWGPLLAHNEMDNPSPGYLINKINAIPDYKGLFEEAFGTGPSIETISRALASYQYTLISGNSPFDRWYYKKDNRAISDEAKKGFDLFVGKGQCITCHLINEDYALFTDEKLHNTGIGYQATMHKEPEKKMITLGAGIVVEVDTSSYAGSKFTPEISPNDLGLYKITQDPNDRWKFRTPPLRNVELTGPYMHNGDLTTLKDVVEFYNKGGVKNEVLSPLIMPLNLNEQEVNQIVEFLKTLTGSNFDELILDAHAAPIGEVSLDDPNWFHKNKLKY
tara:strand:- start:4711 stop:6630 length:1920 start_codon:yes stop_codon:yes gene_type:complete